MKGHFSLPSNGWVSSERDLWEPASLPFFPPSPPPSLLATRLCRSVKTFSECGLLTRSHAHRSSRWLAEGRTNPSAGEGPCQGVPPCRPGTLLPVPADVACALQCKWVSLSPRVLLHSEDEGKAQLERTRVHIA